MSIVNVLTDAVLAIHAIYPGGMRSSLFTGFLTLSSFLLATKTLLVIQFRKDVYEQPDYTEMHNLRRKGQPLTASLRKLADKLNHNILAALATSTAQLTIGLVNHWSASLLCVGLAFYTLTITYVSVHYVRKSIATMFDWIDARHEAK